MHTGLQAFAAAVVALMGIAGTPFAQAGSLHFHDDMVLGADDNVPLGHVVTAVTDSTGNIYLADLGFQDVKVFTPLGRFQMSLGTIGQGPGELMFPFTMAIDSADRLYFAGAGGRVTIWRKDGRYVREFRRLHPDAPAKSIRVDDEDRIYIAAFDVLDQTTIDVYDSRGEHMATFGESYAKDLEVDTRAESFFGGGSLDLTSSGQVLFTQQVPYRILLYAPDGRLLDSTVACGRTFVGEPLEPETHDDRYRVSMPASSVEITALSLGYLNCAVANIGTSEKRTLWSLYDEALRCLASTELEGTQIVIGKDRTDRIFIYSELNDAPMVRRTTLRLVESED